MQRIWAQRALVGGAWADAVAVDIAQGKIRSITPGAAPAGAEVDLLVPAPTNCHSHAFQRVLAGLTERRGAAADSFWTWRDLMFRFLEQITPDQVEAIAAFVQMEMLEAGFGASVEFHYLHHQPGGQPYDRIGEMSERIAAGAAESGIGLTLLPVMYQFGGCDQRALGPGQARFGNALDRFTRLVEDAHAAIVALPSDCRIGTAPHSLRAVAAEDLGRVAALAAGGPVHMHLAEQPAEVAEVVAAHGARPVEWVLDHVPVGPDWCLIHCTQMAPHETMGLTETGAVAGLCPLTEASLGDGIFDGVRWAGTGGRFAVGSDSNIRISLAEELRQLDTSQRLRDGSRAAFATQERSTGRRLIEEVALGGAQAAGRGVWANGRFQGGEIAIGAYADLLALDADHVDLDGLSPDTALDTFVFAGDSRMVREVWSAGRHLVAEGAHIARAAITARYRAAVRPLRDGL
ncbi:MAG: formimidoylglutamate deiminase [Pseudomonadota bacterium]